uniref:A-kinase anchor protein 7-like phosphoesterase domain-containing protein n=1 Tax=Globisporangium ultimum (strain ATCC 200006 / CBS 805.95 / DAOM BR144) TaxID=431595 RepID=K3WA99_GLOUD
MERANGENGGTNSSDSVYRYSNRRSRQRRPPRIRPNFFVGFRITSKELIAQIEELQHSIAQAFPDAASCLVDPQTLHVTLCVLHLKDMEGKSHYHWRCF